MTEYVIYCNGDNKAFNWLGYQDDQPSIFEYPQHEISPGLTDVSIFVIEETQTTVDGYPTYYLYSKGIYLAPDPNDHLNVIGVTDYTKAGEWSIMKTESKDNRYMFNLRLFSDDGHSYLRGNTATGELTLDVDISDSTGSDWMILNLAYDFQTTSM